VGERADITRAYNPDAQDFDRTIAAGTEGESPEAIRVEIDQTRVEMSTTIDALQEKLNPDRLKEQMAETVQEQVAAVREQVTEAVQEHVDAVKGSIHDATIGRAEEMVSNVGRSGLVETIKQNPIPAALAGLGLGWLWMNRHQGRAGESGGYNVGRGQMYRAGASGYGPGQGYGRGQAYYGGNQGGDQSIGDKVGDVAGQAKETVTDTAGQVKETVTDTAGQVKDRVGQFADQAQDQVGEWGGQVQYGAQNAWSRFERTLHENPMGVSAAAIALGLAVGMSLPETPFEDKLMGETRDNVMEKAQSTAQETMQKVGQVAQQVQQTATETVKDEAQKQDLTQTQGTPPQGGGQKQPQTGAQTMPRPPQQGQQAEQPTGTTR